MKYQLIFFIVVYYHCSFGQTNGKNAIIQSVDSLAKIILIERTFDRLVVSANTSIIDNFPETIQNIQVTLHDNRKKIKKRTIDIKDVIFKIKDPIETDRQLVVVIWTYRKTEKGIGLFADAVYVFYFDAIETNQFKLNRLQSGLIL